MSRVKLLNMLMLACLIGSCSQLDPFIDRRRNAGEKT